MRDILPYGRLIDKGNDGDMVTISIMIRIAVITHTIIIFIMVIFIIILVYYTKNTNDIIINQ